jgi:hypothetical protein
MYKEKMLMEALMTTAYDAQNLILYVTISQVFASSPSIASVRLTTVLQLVQVPAREPAIPPRDETEILHPEPK